MGLVDYFGLELFLANTHHHQFLKNRVTLCGKEDKYHESFSSREINKKRIARQHCHIILYRQKNFKKTKVCLSPFTFIISIVCPPSKTTTTDLACYVYVLNQCTSSLVCRVLFSMWL